MQEVISLLTPADKVPFVYGLVDPLDVGHVRYVGMATVLKRRPYDHAREARKPRNHSHLFHWIRSLQVDGREPVALLLESLPEGSSKQFVGEIEKMYISSLRRIGHRLTNVANGGWLAGGNPGVPHSDETKAKISKAHIGIRPSEEVRARISASKCNPSEETRAKLRACKENLSEETKKRLSAAASRGWVDKTPEERRARALHVWDVRRRKAVKL